jgi:hypothetical protein
MIFAIDNERLRWHEGKNRFRPWGAGLYLSGYEFQYPFVAPKLLIDFRRTELAPECSRPPGRLSCRARTEA